MDKLVSLAKRRGFVFQSSEIYGGLGSVWDYGPLGVELKKNIKERWWRSMVHDREDIEGLDAAILMHPKVWEASGHVSGFTDPLVDCKHCKNRFRADDPRIKGTPGEPTAQGPGQAHKPRHSQRTRRTPEPPSGPQPPQAQPAVICANASVCAQDYPKRYGEPAA